MTTLRQFLDEMNEEDFATKLASARQNGARKTAADASEMPPQLGEATAASPTSAPAMPTQGAIDPAGGDVPQLARNTADDAMNKRQQLIDAAMEMSGASQAAAVESARGLGTDEGHNAGINPSTGQQQYERLTAPQDVPHQDPYQHQVGDTAGAGGGGGEEMKAAAAKAAEEKLAAEKFAQEVAEDCIAQGRFVGMGLTASIKEAAETGAYAELFGPSMLAANRAAFLHMPETPEFDQLTTKFAEQVVAKIKAGLQAD